MVSELSHVTDFIRMHEGWWKGENERGRAKIQSNRTRPILQEFVFSPEATCNRKMTRVRGRSMSERRYFYVRVATQKNFFLRFE